MLSVMLPGLRDGRVFLGPITFLEGLQRLRACFGISSMVDGAQRRDDRFPVLIGDEFPRVPDQVDDAGLHDRLGKDGGDRFREPIQPSTKAIRISWQPRLFSSFITQNQNFAPSV